MRRVGQQQSHGAGQQALGCVGSRGGQVGQRGQCELSIEEHHRGGLVGPPALEAIEALHPLLRVRLGGEPVDRVGGEQRHAPNGDAALKGGEVLGGHDDRPRLARALRLPQ